MTAKSRILIFGIVTSSIVAVLITLSIQQKKLFTGNDRNINQQESKNIPSENIESAKPTVVLAPKSKLDSKSKNSKVLVPTLQDAEKLHANNRTDEAAELIEIIYYQEPSNAQNILAMSWKLADHDGNPSAAISILLKQIDIFTADSTTREDFIFALTDIIEAYGISPGVIVNHYENREAPKDVLLLIAKAHLERGDIDQAINHQKEFMNYQLKNGQSYRYIQEYVALGDQLLELNDYENALSAYRDARDFHRIYKDLMPGEYDVELAQKYISILNQLGLFDEIERYKEQLLLYFPNDPVNELI
ncbi:MAG: tetratricopeptide repeat protein [Oligoflexus sp.]